MEEIERAACLFRDDVAAAPDSLVDRMRDFIGREVYQAWIERDKP